MLLIIQKSVEMIRIIWQILPPLLHNLLAEEATESKGGHFAKLKWSSIAKITILWRVLKVKKGHGPPCPPISTAYGTIRIIIAIKNCLTKLGPLHWMKDSYVVNNFVVCT